MISNSRFSFFGLAFIALAMGAIAVSCGKKAPADQAQPVEPIKLVTTNADSTEVISLVNTFMDNLVAGDVAGAVALLGNNDPDSISEYDATPLDLPADVASRYIDNYSKWKVERYEIIGYNFNDFTDNQVRVRAYLTDGTTRAINFNPRKGVNKWRLTFRDSTRGDRPYRDQQ